jgi:hypothetical protein
MKGQRRVLNPYYHDNHNGGKLVQEDEMKRLLRPDAQTDLSIALEIHRGLNHSKRRRSLTHRHTAEKEPAPPRTARRRLTGEQKILNAAKNKLRAKYPAVESMMGLLRPGGKVLYLQPCVHVDHCSKMDSAKKGKKRTRYTFKTTRYGYKVLGVGEEGGAVVLPMHTHTEPRAEVDSTGMHMPTLSDGAHRFDDPTIRIGMFEDQKNGKLTFGDKKGMVSRNLAVAIDAQTRLPTNKLRSMETWLSHQNDAFPAPAQKKPLSPERKEWHKELLNHFP